MKVSIFAGLLLLATTQQVWAEEVPVLVGMCASCHGVQGEGNTLLGAPRLAGQQAGYLLTQLQNFKAGRRAYDPRDQHGVQMRSVIASLSESDFQQLSSYFSNKKITGSEVAKNPGSAQGKALYQGTCASCHGPKGEGFAHLKTPNLSILDGAYIERQLSHYIEGLRGGEAHADELGIWMRGISLQISKESELGAVVDYIGSLSAVSTP